MYAFILIINLIKSIEKYQFIIDEIQNERNIKINDEKNDDMNNNYNVKYTENNNEKNLIKIFIKNFFLQIKNLIK